MDYKIKAQDWFERASNENDDFVKFILLYISLEVCIKLKYSKIRDIKQNNTIKQYFFSNIDKNNLLSLKLKLDMKTLQNMNPKGDHRWNGRLNSEKDFEGIIEFIIRARNNLFHGDKGLDEKRDLFIVTQGNLILQPLVKAVIKETK